MNELSKQVAELKNRVSELQEKNEYLESQNNFLNRRLQTYNDEFISLIHQNNALLFK